MKLISLRRNSHELQFPYPYGVRVLFSYETPVAVCNKDGFWRTETKHSVTTSKHINQWLGGVKAKPASQDMINELATKG